MSGAGKSTLAEKIKEHLENDFTIQLIEGSKIGTKLGVFEFRIRKMDAFVKKVATMASDSSKKNDLVLVAIACSEQKLQNIAREILGPKYHEIYLHCSERSRGERMGKRRLGHFSSIRNFFVVKFYGLDDKLGVYIPLYNFEPPKSPDITIDTDKMSIDESVNTSVNFILPKIIHKTK